MQVFITISTNPLRMERSFSLAHPDVRIHWVKEFSSFYQVKPPQPCSMINEPGRSIGCPKVTYLMHILKGSFPQMGKHTTIHLSMISHLSLLSQWRVIKPGRSLKIRKGGWGLELPLGFGCP